MKLIMGILMAALVVVPNDPSYQYQKNITMINVDKAWSLTMGSQNIRLAMIDSGIDVHHPEFAGQLSHLSYNAYLDVVGLETVADTTGHGTTTSGVIAALTDNGIGIAGIAPDTDVMVIKADEGGRYTPEAISRGIIYAVDNGARIINMSFGGTLEHAIMKRAVEYAHSKDVIMVAASGNSGNNVPNFPAAWEEVIAVGNVDHQTGSIFRTSSYGPHIDLVAPGRYIETTLNNNRYTFSTGTSLSAPHVSGTIALMLAHRPSMTAAQVREALVNTAVDLGDDGRDDYYGHGLIDAYAAMTYFDSNVEEHPPSTEEIIPSEETSSETPTLPEDETTPEETPVEETIIYKITFVSNGSVYLEVEYKEGDVIEIPARPQSDKRILARRSFVGWYNGDGNKLEIGTIVTSDIVYTARYRHRPIIIVRLCDDMNTDKRCLILI